MPPQLRRDFISAKWMSDFSSPGVEQAALAQFIGNGGFERHLRRSAMVLKERRRVLIDGLRACSHGRRDTEDSQAGMHFVARLAGRSDAEAAALTETARRHRLRLYAALPHPLGTTNHAYLRT